VPATLLHGWLRFEGLISGRCKGVSCGRRGTVDGLGLDVMRLVY
jgi:hypothetical protein